MTISKLILNQKEIDKIVKNSVRGTSKIVYGSKAMNKQLLPMLNRPSPDWDVFSNTPKKDAKKLDKKLDKKFGGNYFYVKPAIHYGTWKVVHKGLDLKNPKDDIGIIDFSKGKTPFTTIEKIRYEKLAIIVKEKKERLKDKEKKFRHEKDSNDLKRIKLNMALKKAGVN